MISKQVILGFLFIGLIVVPPAYADNAQSTVEKIITSVSTSKNDVARSETLSKYIDFDDMAESASGTYWQRLSTSQKKQLTQLIRQLVSEKYYPRWHKLFRKGKVMYTAQVVNGKDTYVKTTLTIGKKDSYVNWRLRSHDGSMQVISLSVGKKDLLAKMQKRFQTKLQAAGFNGLICWLKDKLNNDRTGANNDSLGETETEFR